MKTDPKLPRLSKGIVALLVKRGMTLTEVAKLLGVSKSYISRVHSGVRSLTLDHLWRLQESLGEPIPVLFLNAMDPASIPPNVRSLYRAAVKMASVGNAKAPMVTTKRRQVTARMPARAA